MLEARTVSSASRRTWYFYYRAGQGRSCSVEVKTGSDETLSEGTVETTLFT